MTQEETQSFGEFLRTQREMRGVELETLAEITKVPREILLALETDRHEFLPALVFVKGFLRAYARELGLDQNEVVLRYEQFVGEQASADPSPLPGENCYVGGRGGPILLVILLAILAGGAIYYFLTVEENPRETTPPLPAAVKTNDAGDRPLAKKTPGAPAVTLPTPRPTKTSPLRPTPEAASAEDRAPRRERSVPEARAVEPDALPPPESPHLLKVTASGECWVMFTKDNGEGRDYILKAGQSKSVRFSGSIEVQIGNAAAATVEFDGETYENLGPAGRKIKMIFPQPGPETGEAAEGTEE